MPLDESIQDGQAGHLTDHDSIHTQINQLTWGTSTPEGAVTAVVGALFLRTDGGSNTTLYVKESGSGNTGWIPMSDASAYLPLSGGTLTGTLAMGNQQLSGSLDPTGGTHIGDRDYNDARYAELSGATMTGALAVGNQILSGPLDPAGGTHVGDRDYNDARYAELSGATMTGTLALGNQELSGALDPTGGTHVGDRDYNDARYATDATTRIDNTDSPYTVLSSDSVILVDTATAVVTVNLPATAAQSILVKRIIGGTNAVTIARNGSDLIDTDGSTAASKTLGSLGAHWSGSASSADSRWYTIGEHGTVT